MAKLQLIKLLIPALRLVHRFVNNCSDHVRCGFECAGLKTQAQRATLRILDLCNQIRRQVSGIVISRTMYYTYGNIFMAKNISFA